MGLLLVIGLGIAGHPVPASTADGVISTEAVAGSDERIAARLQDIYAEIDALSNVTVGVEAGVVELTGMVSGGVERERAAAIANRIDGVVAVEDAIGVSNEVVPRLAGALNTGLDRLTAVASYLPLFAIALLIIAGCGMVARLIWSNKRLFTRSVDNPFLGNLLRQISGFAVLMTGVLTALELLDATAVVGAVLGAAGVAGLAIGFAFRDTIENYIAGILLSLRQPFSPHDYVAVAGYEGHVARLTNRATVLVTLDGNYVRIPNAKVFQGVLLNYSRNPLRRFAFQVGIGTDVDIAAAQDLARRTLDAMSAVLDEPEPLVMVAELGDSNVIIDVMAWVDQREVSFGKVRSEAIRQIKERFEDAGFDMPEPIYRLRLAADSGVVRVDDSALKPAPADPAPLPGRAPARAVEDDAADVSPEHHMVEQVEQERRRVESEDLLDDHAPQE
jgi:small-conductance mechanosensitive channel